MHSNKKNWELRHASGETKQEVANEAQREANDDKIKIASEGKQGGRRKSVKSNSFEEPDTDSDGE